MTEKVHTEGEVREATLKYFDGDELATTVWMDKYCLRNKNNEPLELTPDDTHGRLAKEFARIEKKYPNPMSEEEIYEVLRGFKYASPGGSGIFGIGNKYSNTSLSNCVAISSPNDDMSSVFETAKTIANLSKYRCGVGCDLSTLRPEGSKVSNAAKTSSGAWSFARLYSDTAGMVAQKGRRGALLLSLNIDHPDSKSFITSKLNNDQISSANISLKITDEFMKTLEEDKEIDLKWKGKVVKTVKAKEIWDLFIDTVTKSGDPGVLWIDQINKNLPLAEYPGFKVVTTNPCLPGSTIISCKLGEVEQFELIENLIGKEKIQFKSWNTSLDKFEWKKGIVRQTGEASKFIYLKVVPPLLSRCDPFTLVPNYFSESLILTPNHEVYTKRGYVPAEDIVENEDEVFGGIYEEWCKVIGKERVELSKPIPIYDITVEDNHNYFADDLLVHNCGELPLSENDSCRLFSINLSAFAKNAFLNKLDFRASFDYDKFQEVVEKSVRLCDDIVDLEIEKLTHIINTTDEENVKTIFTKLRDSAIRGRRIGLGTLGLASMLIKLNMRYDSDEAIQFAGDLFSRMKNIAYGYSVKLAEERGPFPIWDYEIEKNNEYLKRLDPEIVGKPRRAASMLTIPPSGTLSIVFRASSGIEPVYEYSYIRRTRIPKGDGSADASKADEKGDIWREYEVIDPTLQEYQRKFGKGEYDKNIFVAAKDIDPMKRVLMQATLTKHIDHSISSTINLPRGTAKETVDEIYRTAYKLGCKGLTIFVDECKEGILKSKDSKPLSIRKRPKELSCDIHHVSVDKAQWVVFISTEGKGGRPFELFAGKSEKIGIPKKYKTGKIIKHKDLDGRNLYTLICGEGDDELIVGDIINVFDNAAYAGMTRMISLSMRHGVDCQFIAEQLMKGDKGTDLFSFGKSIARVLKKYIPDGKEVSGSDSLCPDCKSKLRYEGGCVMCSCGWSKCG